MAVNDRRNWWSELIYFVVSHSPGQKDSEDLAAYTQARLMRLGRLYEFFIRQSSQKDKNRLSLLEMKDVVIIKAYRRTWGLSSSCLLCKAQKERCIALEEEIGGYPGITNQDFAVFASLQLNLVYRCEAARIQDGLVDWTAELGQGKAKKRQLFGVDWSGANLM